MTRLHKFARGRLVSFDQWPKEDASRQGHLFWPAWVGNVEWIAWDGTFTTFDGRTI